MHYIGVYCTTLVSILVNNLILASVRNALVLNQPVGPPFRPKSNKGTYLRPIDGPPPLENQYLESLLDPFHRCQHV